MCFGVCTHTYICISVGYKRRSRISGLQSRHTFSFTKYCQLAFHKVCTNLHSPKQCTKCQYSTALMTLDIVNFLNFSYTGGCVMVSHCILICITRISDDVEHLYIYITPILIGHLDILFYEMPIMFVSVICCCLNQQQFIFSQLYGLAGNFLS